MTEHPLKILLVEDDADYARLLNEMLAEQVPDAIELRCSGAQWLTATREPVEFDFLMSNVHVGESDFCSRAAGVAQAGGAAA